MKIKLYNVTSRNVSNDAKTGAFRRSLRSKIVESTVEGTTTKTVTDTRMYSKIFYFEFPI